MSFVLFKKCSSFESKLFFVWSEIEINDVVMLCCCSECIEKFGDMVGQQIWESINDCFDVMPVAAVVDEKVQPSFSLF